MTDSLSLENEEFSALAFLNTARDLSTQADQAGTKGVDFLYGKYDVQEDEILIKHSFILAFFWLLQAKNYVSNLDSLFVTAICETIKMGGDTDTNASVVAGLIGSIVGVNRIPKNMVTKLMTFDDSKEG